MAQTVICFRISTTKLAFMSRCTSKVCRGSYIRVTDPTELGPAQSRGFSRVQGAKRPRSHSVPPRRRSEDHGWDDLIADADVDLSPEAESNGAEAAVPPTAQQLLFDDDYFDSDDENDEHRTEWEQRQRDKHTLWKQAAPQLENELLASWELRLNILLRSATSELTLRQEALNESWSLPGCCICDGDSSDVLLSTSRKVRYWGEICTGVLEVPTWTCENCSKSWEPSPLCAGCFPHGTHRISPLEAIEWFNCEILEGYAALGPGTGYMVDGPAIAPAGLTKHGKY